MSAHTSPSIRVEYVERSPRNGSSSGGAKKPGKDPKRRVKFGVPLCDTLRENKLPPALVEMLVYIAQEGVTTTDLFRRPGNNSELKVIIGRLSEGKDVNLDSYNFYTLASVIKKFLLKIPGGVFGVETEKKILKVLEKNQRMEQYDYLHSVISRLPVATQQLLALLFGTWFRIVNHSEFNAMSSEAVAKSVAGSLFHTCADDPSKIDKAVEVLQILIDDFGVANLFGRKNIQYFADMTSTVIRVREKFRYEYRYPAGESTGSDPQLELFALKLQQEAATRGFSVTKNAITEEEYYNTPSSRRSTGESLGLDIRSRPSQPPSPQSLQPHHEYNPHQKLQNVSSSSAPEVNKGYSPTQELSPAKRISTSLSRFDNVKKRQMIRMKKRSNWFLSPSSQSTSGGASSLEQASGSDDALLSDMTISDSSPLSSRRHAGSHGHHSPRLDSSRGYTAIHISTQHSPRSQHRTDVVNGNHPSLLTSPSTLATTPSPLATTPSPLATTPSPLATTPSPTLARASQSPRGGVVSKSSLVPPWDESSSQSRSPSPQAPSPKQHHTPVGTSSLQSSSDTTASKSTPSAPGTVKDSSSPSPAVTSSYVTSTHIASSQVTTPPDMTSERQVRYFMLETFYGSSTHAQSDKQTSAHS